MKNEKNEENVLEDLKRNKERQTDRSPGSRPTV